MDATNIGAKLRELRGNRTLATVSAETGILVSALSNYENGYRIPNDDAKIILARYYGTTTDELFFADNYTKRAEDPAE